MTRKINAETSTFIDFVEALSVDIKTNQTTSIHFPSFESKYRNCFASAIHVCPTPPVLREIGLEEQIIYDACHLQNHMRADFHSEGGAEHGHNGTKESLLVLPSLLSHPIAIIESTSSSSGEKDSHNTSKPIIVMCASLENNKQLFRIAILRPYDFYNGVLCSYNATRITSYYDVDESKFVKLLNNAIKTGRVILFDKIEYEKASFSSNNCDGRCLDSFVINIQKSYEIEIANRDNRLQKHQQLVSDAAQKSLFRFNNPRTLCTSSLHYTPFDEAVALLDSKECQLSDLAQIQNITRLTCDLSRDSQESNSAVLKMDQLVAQKYSEIVNAIKDQYIRERVAVIDNTIIESEEDLDEMYTCAEMYRNDIPTLESYNISFSPQSTSCPDIQRAINDSILFSSDCFAALANVTSIKEDEYYQHIDDVAWDVNLSDI